jgi:putative NIF3 family GTP cyclohydrolase 1 type 2
MLTTIRKIEKFFEGFAPKKNASSDWDNTGVLIESKPTDTKKVLLTIDLTPKVIEECVNKGIKDVISYHPIIFKPISEISDERYIECIRNDISVFCPHSALDPLMNEYLLKQIGSKVSTQLGCSTIAKNDKSVGEIVKRLKEVVYGTERVPLRVSLGFDHNLDYIPDLVCASVGSPGGNVRKFKEGGLVVAGEMSHHSLLYFARRNVSVILMEHSNSERMYLQELKRMMMDEEMREYEVVISEMDKDPVLFV